MPIGVVQEVGATQKGAPFAVLDGQRYYAGRCDIADMKPGMRVEYVSQPFGTAGRDGKHPQGLQKWRAILDATGAPQTASTVTEADILRSVSNVVGSACAAGTVDDARQLDAWFKAAYQGFMDMAAKDAAEVPEKVSEKDFDDSEIPW